MSDPGNVPPQDPYAQPNPYGAPSGQPAPPPYGQQYGQPGAGQPAYGATAPVYDYASWFKRVAAYFIDAILINLSAVPAAIVLVLGIQLGSKDMSTYTDSYGNTTTTGDWNNAGTVPVIIGALLFLVPLVFAIWNVLIKQGRTGYTIGKGVLGIKLIGEADAQPIGAGMSFVRQICHVLDSFCYIGYLWPLWDPKSQTFADKILKTVVINQPK